VCPVDQEGGVYRALMLAPFRVVVRQERGGRRGWINSGRCAGVRWWRKAARPRRAWLPAIRGRVLGWGLGWRVPACVPMCPQPSGDKILPQAIVYVALFRFVPMSPVSPRFFAGSYEKYFLGGVKSRLGICVHKGTYNYVY